jgi:exopolysaccharide biosynthesis polyprenyl glycosylphosphotransferase
MNSIFSRKAVPWLLLASDVVGLIVCFNTASWLRLERLTKLGETLNNTQEFSSLSAIENTALNAEISPIIGHSALFYFVMALFLLGLYIADTYRLDRCALDLSSRMTPARVLLSLALVFGTISSLIYMAGVWGTQPITGRGILLLGTSFFAVWAVATRLAMLRWLKQKLERSRWLVIGKSPEAVEIEREYCALSPDAEFIFWNEPEHKSPSYARVNCAVSVEAIDTLEILSQQNWSGVLIARATEPLSDSVLKTLMAMRLRGICVYELSTFYEQFWGKIPSLAIADDWFAFTSGFILLHHRINVKIKRLVDMTISGALLLATLPLMLLVALAIRIDSPGPVFYSQVRTGINKRPFKVHKFRSMYRDAEKRGIQWASSRDPRITRVGGWLRAMRIDELPQLLNVLRGEMSLIGPRPERPEFDLKLREEIPYYDLRYLVKPGITGWAQVNYPYGSSVEDAYQKVAYDLYYIKNYSLWLDATIILKTIRVVFLGKGR